MQTEKITVSGLINAPISKVWEAYTIPEHITKWNFASDTWHCPRAENNVRVGGRYLARMEAKDGSMGFDFDAVYTAVEKEKSLSYEFGGRMATVVFEPIDQQTQVTVTFDVAMDHPAELQRRGWQSILNNFKRYTESR